jgi:2,4-dienoyl-CoA reductase-like NADH-dependent reductase (Old Yellow Enzyme family)
MEGGITIEDSVAFCQALKKLGCDFVDVSSGGNDPNQKITLVPGYQVPFADAIKKATGLPVMAVGLITEPEQAEAIIAEGKADMIAIARAFLDDPHWAWHAAYRLNATVDYPVQYVRVAPRAWQPAERHMAKS